MPLKQRTEIRNRLEPGLCGNLFDWEIGGEQKLLGPSQPSQRQHSSRRTAGTEPGIKPRLQRPAGYPQLVNGSLTVSPSQGRDSIILIARRTVRSDWLGRQASGRQSCF